MPDPFVDYYELLQVPLNAEGETIQRVFNILAARYHPENPQTGDPGRYLLLTRALETLSKPESRTAYDVSYRELAKAPIALFQTRAFNGGMEGEANRRLAVLCLLYLRRRRDPERPGISILEFEAAMQIPREHLAFTMWGLKERQIVTQDERSDYVITGEGSEYLESQFSANSFVNAMLQAAEDGQSRSATFVFEPGA